MLGQLLDGHICVRPRGSDGCLNTLLELFPHGNGQLIGMGRRGAGDCLGVTEQVADPGLLSLHDDASRLGKGQLRPLLHGLQKPVSLALKRLDEQVMVVGQQACGCPVRLHDGQLYPLLDLCPNCCFRGRDRTMSLGHHQLRPHLDLIAECCGSLRDAAGHLR